MKRKDLENLIKECYNEVLNEESTATIAARNKEKDEKEQWLRAKKAATDAEISDLRKSKTSTSIYENDLEEMARIPKLYSLNPEAKTDDLKGMFKKIADFLKDNPKSSRLQVTHALGKTDPASVTPAMRIMVNDGIIDDEGLKHEPVYKKDDDTPGVRGRKITPGGAKKRAIRSVYDKLMDGREDEISFDEQEILGDETIENIKKLVAQGGIKRGRKPKEKEEEPEMFSQGGEDEEYYKDDFDLPTDPDEKGFDMDSEFETDELTQLINIKNNLLDALKNKRITLAQYKQKIGDIPQKIKKLQGSEEPVTDDDLFEHSQKIRMQELANIK